MCLVNKKFIKKSKKDIVSYKLMYHGNSPSYIYTPFTLTRVEIDLVKNHRIFKSEDKKRLWEDIIYPGYGVTAGFIHTCKTLEGAKKLKKWFGEVQPWKNVVIYECIIPAGSSYCIGHDDWHRGGYASNKLKFIKEVG